MKKKYLIIILLLLVVSFGYLFFMLLGKSKMNQITNKELIKLDNIVTDINKEINKYKYGNKGTILVNAIYKGAHGEHYPHEFTYNFNYESNILSLESNGSYFDKEINYSNIINLIKNINIKDFINKSTKEVNFRNVSYDLNINKINDLLNKNYKKGTIDFEYKGLVPKLDCYVITIDDITITKKGSDFIYNKDNNTFKLTISNNSYSININNYLKANYIVKDDVANIAVVIDKDAYTIKLSENEIYFKANNSHAIYNGLELTINFDETIKLNEKVLNDENNIPMYRYFNDTNYQIWR